MFLPFWDLSFSKKAEFCQNPEFLLGLSFSQNVEKKKPGIYLYNRELIQWSRLLLENEQYCNHVCHVVLTTCI